MRKLLFLILASSFSINLVAQKEVCETPEDSFDVNSITKCTIKESKKSKKTRQITVRVSSSRSRYLKKREDIKKRSAVNNASHLNTSGVSSIDSSSELKESLALKNNIANITNNLSAEELRKASKFSAVDKIPLFESCRNSKKSDRMNCFNMEMIKHIQKYFRYPGKAVRERIQGDVWIRFVIDKNGNISNVKTLGPKGGEILNDEAKRVVAQLPRFIPAKKNGEKTSVKYGFPISFSLEE
ncbi:energy transducer TonB [Tenacibaculum aiptasiae]|uniref:energy transducer TonB n=1 Tax=Tenacibaculum aiptasiae TaxID=426481 RepID=UPI003B58B9B7